jgi:hypothetical protein
MAIKNRKTSARVDLSSPEAIDNARLSGRVSPQEAAKAKLALAKQPAFTVRKAGEGRSEPKAIEVRVNPPATSAAGKKYGASVSLLNCLIGNTNMLTPAKARELAAVAQTLIDAANFAESEYAGQIGG